MPIDFRGEKLQYVRELQRRAEMADLNWARAIEMVGERNLEIKKLTAELESALDEVGRLENRLMDVRAENGRLEGSNQTAHKLEIDAPQRYEAERKAHEKTKQQLAELKNHVATKVIEQLDNGKLKLASMDLSVSAYY